MGKNPKLRDLISRAKEGDEEAIVQLVKRFTPIVKKYTGKIGNGEMYSNLIEWIIKAVKRYQPDTRYFSQNKKRNDIDGKE
ncbi:MAG: helix-turn-helix domain-containing protein [Thermosediminibacteraceae bacterium]|nr:helix-turn-helix domain-containing protein [Thermosediminibacteraceae bacterium]